MSKVFIAAHTACLNRSLQLLAFEICHWGSMPSRLLCRQHICIFFPFSLPLCPPFFLPFICVETCYALHVHVSHEHMLTSMRHARLISASQFQCSNVFRCFPVLRWEVQQKHILCLQNGVSIRSVSLRPLHCKALFVNTDANEQYAKVLILTSDTSIYPKLENHENIKQDSSTLNL